MIKLYLGVGLAFLIVSGVAWGQYHQIGKLKSENKALEVTVQEAIAERERINVEREELEKLLLERNNERKLLYIETNALKKKIRDIKEDDVIEWRTSIIPPDIRLLRESRIRQ